MCERCWLDMMMYGEAAADHGPPVFEKGRFQAQAVEPSGEGEAENAKPGGKENPKERRERE